MDDYADRQQFRQDYPEIMQINFIEFVSKYTVKEESLHLKPKIVVVRTFPNYYSNPLSPYYGLFCKYQLMKFKPWNCKPSNLWNDEDETDETFITHWNLFLQSPEAQCFVPNWKYELDNVSAYFEQVQDEHDFEEPFSGEREEWMLLSELNASASCCSTELTEIQQDDNNWEADRQYYSDEQIGNMTSWISSQKEQFDVKTMKQDLTDIATLNKEQHLAHAIVFDHFIQQNKDPLLILTGLAGSGKSYVINAIKTLLKDKCKVCAFFGIAAFNVKGKTLHSLLQLPIGGKRSSELKGQALKRLQDETGQCTVSDN